MGGEQSKAFYGDFLQAMKSAYKPDAIKGDHCNERVVSGEGTRMDFT